MLTPVADFGRLVGPCPCTVRSLTSRCRPQAPPSLLQQPDQLATKRTSRSASPPSPEGLGSPCPSNGLGSKGVIPETPDTVIRFAVANLDPRERERPRVRPSRENLNGFGAEDRRTAFAVSPPSSVVRMTNGGTASFGLGTSRDVAPCETPPDKHPTIRSSDICFPNSRLRVPVLAGSWHRPESLRTLRKQRTLGSFA